MTTATAQKLLKQELASKDSQWAGCKISLEDFRDWEPEPDGWKLEWKNGKIEAGEATMKKSEWHLMFALLNAFERTQVFKEKTAKLVSEPEFYLPKVKAVRTPDLGYLTAKQVAEGTKGEDPVPAWVIEVVSPNDRSNKLDKKISEYFAAGVDLVWYIHPEQQYVRIYRSPYEEEKLHGDDVCSAAPIVPDFQITVSELFAAAP